MRSSTTFVMAAVLCGATSLFAVTVNDYAAGTTTFNGERILYRLFTPKNMVQGQRYPLVLTLHGVGEGGTDNTKQLNNGATVWANEPNQAVRPCIVFSPQSATGWSGSDWGTGVCVQSPGISKSLATVIRAIDSLVNVLPVDTNRLYVTGLSMGGMGTWDLIMRFPSKFAAAVPVCGAIDTTKLIPLASHRIWTYHGSNDGIINPLGTRTAMRKFVAMGQPVIFPLGGAVAPSPSATMTTAALLAALPTAKKLYAEIPGGGHGAWDNAYVDTMMFKWLFMQSKTPSTGISSMPAVHAMPSADHVIPAERFSFSGRRIGRVSGALVPGVIIGGDGRTVIRMASEATNRSR